ncbi:MAG: hypothetical protein U0165_04505 [Polyangiaceae bacterium]
MTLRISTLALPFALAALLTGCRETDHTNFKGGPASTTNTPTAAATNPIDLMVARANTQPGTGGPASVSGAMAFPGGHVEDIAGDAGKGAVQHGHGEHGDHGGHRAAEGDKKGHGEHKGDAKPGAEKPAEHH